VKNMQGLDNINESNFNNLLDMLDMTCNSGLVFTVDKDDLSKISHESERIALETAEKYKASAVYFRRFPNGRPSIPQIYVYDYTSKQLGETEKQDIATLHKYLWNSALVPLFFVFTKTEISIFNCHRQPDLDNITGQVRYSVFQTIELAAIVENNIKNFSGKLFDNGAFWELSEFKDEFRLDQSVYEKLLDELKKAKAAIVKRGNLPKKFAQKILVMIILVKYLEEREDDNGSSVFPEGFFGQFVDNATCLVDLLRTKGACLRLFDFLSEHFNGKIFEWSDAEERKLLAESDLNYFADFLGGKIDGKQYVLWPLYSFNYLPVELISNIYEDFLQDQRGVVYTPPYLVNFLVDEVIPLKDDIHEMRVLDPACGSGIFLVAVFRRLVDRWRLHNNWQKPELKILKEILRNNIFGVDIDKEAVRLTAFSLSLTLCDMLSPKVIWEDLKFDNLFERNLLCSDYFQLIEDNFFREKFDVVIGNPPFISSLDTDAAKKIEHRRRAERPSVPDDQVALLFLDQVITTCKSGGLVCLILPAGPILYNENSFGFRKDFLNNSNVLQIIDFSALNKILFKSAKVSVVALFAKNERPNYSENILHVTVRRTKATRERFYFEIDHYDFHKVKYREGMEDRMVWKANFLGGGRIKHLINRLSCQRTLGQYLDDKVKNLGWKVGEGYQSGSPKDKARLKELLSISESLSQYEQDELNKLTKKFRKGEHITGKRSLPAEGLTEDGVDTTKIFIQNDELFMWPRTEGIFKGPHVLIREWPGKHSIPVSLYDEYLTFPAQIIGIHAPEEYIVDLKRIEERIKDNKLYLFYLAACSGRYMISKHSSVLKSDINKLPYPEDESELSLSEIEETLINDFLENGLDFYQRGEESRVFSLAQREDFRLYSKIYCRILNSVYKDLKPLETIETESFVCFPFYFKEKPKCYLSNENIEQNLRELLLKDNYHSNLRILRVLRVYDENVIYQIKPRQLRFWLPSVAIRDADETFSQLLEQGY
jgi:hypothetical protein